VGFYTGLVPLTIVYTVAAMLLWPLPLRYRLPIIASWPIPALWWLRLCCGLGWRIHGLDKLPKTPSVIMCKHQSAWETMALTAFFPRQIWVLKKEILWLPFFGQAVASLAPIAIDRARSTSALKQLLDQGVQRLRAGYWIAIYPEGTRVKPGERRRYSRSGAELAVRARCPLVPIAHNAGLFWPRKAFVKRPGVIDMVVGEPITPDSKSATELTEACEAWIERTTAELCTPQPALSRQAGQRGRRD
jgi:1-acyl-sn-glycerol-3-phosphate acyltransferase